MLILKVHSCRPTWMTSVTWEFHLYSILYFFFNCSCFSFFRSSAPFSRGIASTPPRPRGDSSVLQVWSRDQKKHQPQLGTCYRRPFSGPATRLYRIRNSEGGTQPSVSQWGPQWFWMHTEVWETTKLRVFSAIEPVLGLEGLPLKVYDFILMGFCSFVSRPYPWKSSKNYNCHSQYYP